MNKYYLHIYWNGLESPTEFDVTEDVLETIEEWEDEDKEARAEDYLIGLTFDLFKTTEDKDYQDFELIGGTPVIKSQIRMAKYEIREVSERDDE